MGVTAPKGSRGRSESPLVASAEAKPLHDYRIFDRRNSILTKSRKKSAKKRNFFEKQAGESQNTSNINTVRVFGADRMREWRNWQTR